jgi:hypothetical protein
MKHILLGFIFILSAAQLFSQGDSKKIKYDLAIRYRFELWNGMNAKNYGDDSENATGKLNDKILYQRVITGLTYTPSGTFTAALHLQDSRAFGWSLRRSQYPDLWKTRESGTTEPYYIMNPGEEYFEIYDAFVQYQTPDKEFTATLGRQKIFFGDNHLFGPGNWGNTGRWTWDALRLTYAWGKNTIDVFGGGTKIHDPEKISIPFLKTEFFGGGFYGHFEFKNIIKLEPFYIYKRQGSADYINTQQFGRFWIGSRLLNENIHNFIFDGTFAYEGGSENEKPINAYGFFAKVGYKFNFLKWEPILSLRETYASGGKKADASVHNFEPAYGSSDKFYGWLNIVKWSNINDREINCEFRPKKEYWIEIKYNLFYVPVPDDFVLLKNLKLIPGKKHLGDEIDIFARFKVKKHWEFTGLFGYFFPDDVQPINGHEAKNSVLFALQVLFTL